MKPATQLRRKATPPVQVLQDCLAAEHAAVYGYGVLGGVLAKSDESDESESSDNDEEADEEEYAHRCYQQHRHRRDELIALIRQIGKTPVAAKAVYALPFAVDDAQSSRRLARRIENRCAAVYADAVAHTGNDTRKQMARTLRDCAVREVRWGADPDAFPGIEDL